MLYNNKVATRYAGVLELADETDSKSVASNGVWVQVPPPAPNEKRASSMLFFYFILRKVGLEASGSEYIKINW